MNICIFQINKKEIFLKHQFKKIFNPWWKANHQNKKENKHLLDYVEINVLLISLFLNLPISKDLVFKDWIQRHQLWEN